jgi:thymidylate kinase
MIIGLEGVSCTGKSTLARGLAARLGAASVVPCYYHAAPDPSALPSPKVASEDEQIDALVIHLDIEEIRLRAVREQLGAGGPVILDRTVDTLLAHVRAVGAMNGLDANARARALVAERITQDRVAVPDMTLLLRADPGLLAARALARPGLPPLYYNPEFTIGFLDHFQNPVTPACLDIDASLPPGEVLDRACRLLGGYLAGQR